MLARMLGVGEVMSPQFTMVKDMFILFNCLRCQWSSFCTLLLVLTVGSVLLSFFKPLP